MLVWLHYSSVEIQLQIRIVFATCPMTPCAIVPLIPWIRCSPKQHIAFLYSFSRCRL